MRIIAILALALFVLVPTASAHERYTSPDGAITMVLGEQSEPVYTYDFTNLDIILSYADSGEPVLNVHQARTLTATLIAPDGQELTRPLAAQHGQPGRYDFNDDYQLTQAGQYHVRLEGHIEGHDMNGTYRLPGPREDMRNYTFPATDVPDLLQLQAEIAALEDRVDTLEANQGTKASTGYTPGLQLGFLTVCLAITAYAVRRQG